MKGVIIVGPAASWPRPAIAAVGGYSLLPRVACVPHYRSRALVLQLDEEDLENEDGFLSEIEDVLSESRPAPNVDPALRIQRAIGRRASFSNGRNVAPRLPRQSSKEPPRYTRESTQLFRLPSTLRGAYDDFLERPGQPLVLGGLALLVGFYLAGSLSTIFGASGFWEPTAALGPTTVCEIITRRYYSNPMRERSQTIRLLNALKVGFYLGIVIDALKLAG